MIIKKKHNTYKIKRSVIISYLLYKPNKGFHLFWRELTALHRDGAALVEEANRAIEAFEALQETSL